MSSILYTPEGHIYLWYTSSDSFYATLRITTFLFFYVFNADTRIAETCSFLGYSNQVLCIDCLIVTYCTDIT
jgi:hypothetical protein